ncbi:hypothetical protein N7470_003357 [Penicillium chermesinum]|nr:hypothetical protein N7470_003357 [Penicillium chermesinum]
MQPLVLHPPSLATPFGPTRFIPGPERLLNRPWADPRGCSPQAAFTRQSMSGSPPAEEPSVASAESNPSRYPLASSPAPSAAEEAPVVSHPRPHRPSLGNDPLPTTIPPISAVAPVSVPSVPLIPPRYPDPGPLYTDPSHAHPELPQFPLAAFDRSISGAGPRAIAQRSTRRTKAHVASACVNCKKEASWL